MMSSRYPRICSVDGCDRQMRAYGLCQQHRRQQLRGEGFAPIKPSVRVPRAPGAVCSFPDCGRPLHGARWCGTHSNQAAAGRELRPIQQHARLVGPCHGPGCDRESTSKVGLCKSHAKQLRVRGDMALLAPLGARTRRPSTPPPTPTPPKPKAPGKPRARKPMPPGWDRPAPRPTPPTPSRGTIAPEVLIDSLPSAPTPAQAAQCLANLRRWGALDLAEMLGLEAA